MFKHQHSPLAHPGYRRLYGAQVVALLGTGLTTIALTLLAYDLAGDGAGEVVGIALALKMVAYVLVAPVIAGLTQQLPRRAVLVALDLLRAAAVVAMPLVTEVWQVYALILALNACSAGFTPTFQAVIPDLLDDEPTYTRALSLSRLAYELESLASPALAAAALSVLSYDALFVGNAAAFLGSAALVASVAIPRSRTPLPARGWDKVSLGTRRYLATPRLRGLLALSLAAAAASAMVIVNTVVYVRDQLGRDAGDVAWALGASGAGAMVTALLVPRLLERVRDRSLMLAGGAILVGGLLLAAAVASFAALVGTWLLLGVGLSLVQTPAGRLIQRSARDDLPALFAAQFSLSHLCWLATYPIAGVLGAALGLPSAALLLAAVAAVALLAALVVWPSGPAAPGRSSGRRAPERSTRPRSPGASPGRGPASRSDRPGAPGRRPGARRSPAR